MLTDDDELDGEPEHIPQQNPQAPQSNKLEESYSQTTLTDPSTFEEESSFPSTEGAHQT